jgi:hypothetical protein
MPKCKRDYCNEQAVPYGKRLCPKHLAEYHQKQRAYMAVQATLRSCRCGAKLTKTAHDRGDTLCASCQRAEDDARAESAKRDRLYAAETVDDLRDWIAEYVL